MYIPKVYFQKQKENLKYNKINAAQDIDKYVVQK